MRSNERKASESDLTSEYGTFHVWIPLTARSTFSSVWRMFFWINSSGPGRWDNWSLSESANRARFSIRWRSASDGSTLPVSAIEKSKKMRFYLFSIGLHTMGGGERKCNEIPSRMCWRMSSVRSGLCWILCLSRSPILARCNFWRCSWNDAGVFNAVQLL